MKPVWTLVHAERQALVDDLATLDDDQWEMQSLCPGWSVHDVVAHLVNNAKVTRLGIIRDMARARFDFDRQNANGVAAEKGATPAETLTRLDAVVAATNTPPAPLDSRLVEEVVHGEDIRRPLGLRHEYAPEAVVRALGYQARTSVKVGGGKQRIAGVRLVATDADLAIGEGPQVRGPALSLLLVTSGRDVALADLTGPGLTRLG
ncbi:maleylpyruvate isomerase family mycothiol-dependent enzyme [Knoellia koreensis]|uniref:Maleylpyruvate isomerase family mycothiol-dependent enzyme n=1 Tax=Knoellia koreensis TaxID=2730921 RepID=A0A849HJ69_9MICO|nr:maleylpyruvate isomerase family mycothiol-dependent enzyme [Knoellia sp. DB2414S]NNM47478.1 maleylpyruvate isomerase family mycothiol-dependent enzyme [Knoellia sp. DB2414S]